MKRLPVCPRRGLPIPYVTARTHDGPPDFTVLDSDKVRTVAERRLCGMCGEPLGYWIAFAVGPRAFGDRVYPTPPMHPDTCVRAALRLCPRTAREDMRRPLTPRSDAVVSPGLGEGTPAEVIVHVIRSYRYTVTGDGVLFHPEWP